MGLFGMHRDGERIREETKDKWEEKGLYRSVRGSTSSRGIMQGVGLRARIYEGINDQDDNDEELSNCRQWLLQFSSIKKSQL